MRKSLLNQHTYIYICFNFLQLRKYLRVTTRNDIKKLLEFNFTSIAKLGLLNQPAVCRRSFVSKRSSIANIDFCLFLVLFLCSCTIFFRYCFVVVGIFYYFGEQKPLVAFYLI